MNYINYCAFVLPPIKDAAGNALSPFGNASRNPGRTPAFNETDLDLNKKFNTPIETLKIEFRAEAYNVFNHTNLYLPNISGTQGTTPSTLGAGATPGLAAISGGVPIERRTDYEHVRAADSAVRLEDFVLSFGSLPLGSRDGGSFFFVGSGVVAVGGWRMESVRHTV